MERNEFFEMLYTACVQVNSGEILSNQLHSVREPIWAWMRQHCASFTGMSDNALFSDIFQINTFGELKFGLKSLFLIQHTNHSICSECNQEIFCLVYYLSPYKPEWFWKVLYQKLCCQTSIYFFVFTPKIILEVLLHFDTLCACQPF